MFNTRTNTIHKHHWRGKISDELRREALYLAGNYRDKELMNNDYALTDMRETWNWNTFTRRQKSG